MAQYALIENNVVRRVIIVDDESVLPRLRQRYSEVRLVPEEAASPELRPAPGDIALSGGRYQSKEDLPEARLSPREKLEKVTGMTIEEIHQALTPPPENSPSRLRGQ